MISNILVLQNTKKYNPQIHHRKSIWLKGYYYSQAGAYFITICCQNRECRFGKICNGKMVLNDLGIIAHNQWLKLTERFTKIELDVFQIMPNHMHGIIVINDSHVGATLAVAPDDVNDLDLVAGAGHAVDGKRAEASHAPTVATVAPDDVNDLDLVAGAGHAVDGKRAGASPAPTKETIGLIVGAYKSLVANKCLNLFKIRNESMGKLWQRNYYEHIIRNETSYQTISDYIINNPDKWIDDKFFIE